MRILMVSYSYYESDNRVRRYAETLARRGDSVEVISLRRKKQSFQNILNNVRIFRIQVRNINEKNQFQYFIKLILFLINSFFYISLKHLKKPYQIIHIHSVPDFEVFAAFLAKMTGAKVVLDIHDIVPEFYSSKFNSGNASILSNVLMKIERACCSFSDHVIISNHIWGERLIARSVNKEKCSVILNYPDLNIFRRTRKKLNKNKFIILYPGTYAWHQGIDVAIRAMAVISKIAPQVEFHIYGKGPEESSLNSLISELHITENVKIGGILSIEETVDKMMDADLGIVPKRNDGFGGDAFSTKILEFMALEVPVLIAETRIDRFYFNDTIVTFFKNGDENDLAEKVIYLTKNPDRLKLQCTQALDYIANNNWNIKKNEYLKIVDSL